jgi:hypothetical protein
MTGSPSGGAPLSPRPVGSAVVAELRKVGSTPLWWVLALGVLLLGSAFAAVPALVELASGGSRALGSSGAVLAVYHGGNTLARILALVLGTAAAAEEYRYATVASTFLAVPRRGRVLAAKVAALGLVGLLYGVLNLAAGAAVALAVLVGRGVPLHLGETATWRSVGLGVVSVALWAVAGVGIGSLLRSLPVAVLVGVAFAYLVDPGLSTVFLLLGWNVPLNLMPTGATDAMLGVSSPAFLSGPDPWAWWAGLLVLLGWCVAATGIGSVITLRRDV